MKKLIYVIALVSLFTASCSSDDSSSDNAQVLVKKLIETTDNGSYTINYSYIGNKLDKITHDDGRMLKYVYTGNDITAINFFDNNVLRDVITNEYNDQGQLIEAKRIVIGANMGFRTVYTHNSDGTISATSFSGDETDQDHEQSSGKYYMTPDGEIAKHESYSGLGTSTTTFTYDTKNHPFKNVEGYDKMLNILGNNRNVLSEITTDQNQIETNSQMSTHIYNDDNYPTQSVRGNDQYQVTSQYFYE